MKLSLLAVALLLAPAAAPAESTPCRVVKLANLPIEFTRLQPTLQGRFNGVDLRLVMDSGAINTTLFPSAVRKASLSESHSNLENIGVGGRSQTYIAHVDEVKIGPSSGKNLRFLEAVSNNVAADGLLGADYLFRTDLELVLRDNQVTFTQPDGDCDKKLLAYWDHDADWVESSDAGGSEDRRQQVEVRINGHRFTALLDTGATQSVLDLQAARWIGLTPDAPGMEYVGEAGGVGAKKMTVWRARTDSFEIGHETIQHAQIQVGDLFGAARKSTGRHLDISGPDMLLGADFMRAHHLLFARSQHRLYFSYLGGPVFQITQSPAELVAQVAGHLAGAEKNMAADMLALAQELTAGRGVEVDRVEAYKWLLIASKGSWAASHPDFDKAVQREVAALLEELDEQQAAEGRQRAAAWTPPQ
jgi:predicted aspartyl protease